MPVHMGDYGSMMSPIKDFEDKGFLKKIVRLLTQLLIIFLKKAEYIGYPFGIQAYFELIQKTEKEICLHFQTIK